MWYWGETDGSCNSVSAQHMMNSIEYFRVGSHVNNVNWGIEVGVGSYALGDTAILTAIPNYGYSFENWSLQDSILSTDATLFVPVDGNIEVNANFERQRFSINAKTESENTGIVSGNGDCLFGDTVTLRIEPFAGYIFKRWVEDDNMLSDSMELSIVIDRNHVLSAEMESINVVDPVSINYEIYPNPSHGNITINASCIDCVRLYNLKGKLLMGKRIVSEKEVLLDLKTLTPNIYFLQLHLNGDVRLEKLIIL